MPIKCDVRVVGREAYPSYNFLEVPRPGDRIVLPAGDDYEHFTVVSVSHYAADAYAHDAAPPALASR